MTYFFETNSSTKSLVLYVSQKLTSIKDVKVVRVYGFNLKNYFSM